MSKFSAELIGTMILIILGDGVVANVLLNRSKGQNSGWIVIAVGWGLAVAVAVYAVGSVSGGHLNPAVTMGLAAIGKFPWSKCPKDVGSDDRRFPRRGDRLAGLFAALERNVRRARNWAFSVQRPRFGVRHRIC